MSRALVIGVVLALVVALSAGGYHATYDCIGAHCGMVFVREDGRR